MKPLQGGPATAIRIPVVLCGAPSVKTKTLSTKKKGPECSTDRGLTESSGEVFLLDILSHRMVSGRLYETTPGGSATATRIPVVLCGAPSVKTKTLSTME